MVDCRRFHPPEDDGVVLTPNNSVFNSIIPSMIVFMVNCEYEIMFILILFSSDIIQIADPISILK